MIYNSGMSVFRKACSLMHSVLQSGIFCMNYCINTAWHAARQPAILLRRNGSRGCSDSGLELNWIVGSGVLKETHILFGVPANWADWPMTVKQWPANQLLVVLVSAGRCNVLLEKEFSISAKLVSGQKREVHFLTLPGRCLRWVWTW